MYMREILKKWNPWWNDERVPENRKGIERKSILNELHKLISTKEMVILTGVRRSGKSTIMHQIIDLLLRENVIPKNILF